MTKRYDLTSAWQDLGAVPLSVEPIAAGGAILCVRSAAPAPGSTDGRRLEPGCSALLCGPPGQHVFGRAASDLGSAVGVSEASPAAGGISKTMRVVTLPPYADGGSVTTIAPDGTESTTAVAASTAVQVLPANAGRRSLRIANVDVNRATYAYDSWCAPGWGWPIGPAAAVGDRDDDLSPHIGAIYAASASGTTLVIIEG